MAFHLYEAHLLKHYHLKYTFSLSQSANVYCLPKKNSAVEMFDGTVYSQQN